jgi:hypothetical protein
LSRCLSANPLEQLCERGELEPAGEDYERLQAGGALAALQETDLGAVQIAGFRERLLGEACSFPEASEVGGELLADGFHDGALSLLADGRSTDACLRKSANLRMLEIEMSSYSTVK